MGGLICIFCYLCDVIEVSDSFGCVECYEFVGEGG